MVFALIILALFFVVVYFHYLQGFFSATLSAILAVLAALVAISYHEMLVDRLLQGRFADMAYGSAMVVLFAATYGILRLIFDKLVPGNVNIPYMVDKAGGAAMGVVAATFSTGVLAVAAQTLPFGPTVAGYARYDLTGTRNAVLPTNSQAQDVQVYGELESHHLEPSEHSGLLLPVDDAVIGLTSYISLGGSLAGARPMTSVHPAYLDEMFAGRLGIEPGAKLTALGDQIKVKGLYSLDLLPQVDHEYEQMRSSPLVESPSLVPAEDQVLLVVRIGVEPEAADKVDTFFRFSPGAVRLVTRDMEYPDRLRWKNYHPVGTLGGSTLYRNRVDDFLFARSGSSQIDIDLAFLVNKQDLFPQGIPEEGQAKVGDGALLVVKRMAVEELAGMAVDRSLPSEQTNAVVRKVELLKRN